MENKLVIVRGGGDIATASIQKIHRCGYKLLILEVEKPSFVRRNVSLARAIYDKEARVEDIKAIRIEDLSQCQSVWDQGCVPIIVDQEARSAYELKPLALVDAIIAKKNIGTKRDMAGLTIAMGPGFVAGEDVDVVIETNRGHNLGRLIYQGQASPNTGVPGSIEGESKNRVFRSSNSGTVEIVKDIGSLVWPGQVVAKVDGLGVKSNILGLVRGMITEGSYVKENQKIGDVDPRIDYENIDTISDKGRNIAGGVLEAIVSYENRKAIER